MEKSIVEVARPRQEHTRRLLTSLRARRRTFK